MSTPRLVKGWIAPVLAAWLAACGQPTETRSPLPRLTWDARELVVGIVDDWTATTATLRRYRRDGDEWKPSGAAWPAVVGKAGTAWGTGVHGTGAPAGREGPVKHEGDSKSPAGVFAIGASYGSATASPTGSRLRYTPIDDAWKCVDDPASKAYNRVLDQRTTTIDWKSAEEMKRGDALYTWVVDVAHNVSRTPNRGSCIFLHVWSGPESATLGCTAMAEPVLAELIATIDPSAMFVLLPRAEYAALATSWGLPL